MKGSSKKLLFEIEKFLSEYFKGRKYFACIYGSYANGKRNRNSDIDLLVATKKYTKKDLLDIKEFIINLHRRNKLKIDNEVPFENKLMINYQDFNDAVNLKAFNFKNGVFIIPKVIKSKKFLESRQIKLRLSLNAITSPHFFFGNDKSKYLKFKNLGENNVFNLSNKLSKSNKPNKNDLIKILLNRDGRSGEMYLGYKDYPLVRKYLGSFISKYLTS